MKPPVPRSSRLGGSSNENKDALGSYESSSHIDDKEESKKEELSETQQEVRQMIKDVVDSGSKNKLAKKSSREHIDESDDSFYFMHGESFGIDDENKNGTLDLEKLNCMTIDDDFMDSSSMPTEIPGLNLYEKSSNLSYSEAENESTVQMNDRKSLSVKNRERCICPKEYQLREVEQKMVEALKGKIDILKQQTKQRQNNLSIAKNELKKKIAILQRCYSELSRQEKGLHRLYKKKEEKMLREGKKELKATRRMLVIHRS
uniref:Uncharacterized protein n=1 Tax=Leptocylindrus danicus TaxID=163516 RepID=A0A7S2LQX2_9STRA